MRWNADAVVKLHRHKKRHISHLEFLELELGGFVQPNNVKPNVAEKHQVAGATFPKDQLYGIQSRQHATSTAATI